MLAVWMNKHFKVPISTFLLAVNAVIFIFVAILFSIEQAMFSLAIFYIVTKMIDFILDGINQGKSVMIISGKNKEIGVSTYERIAIIRYVSTWRRWFFRRT